MSTMTSTSFQWKDKNIWVDYPFVLNHAIDECEVGCQIRFNTIDWSYRLLKTSAHTAIQQNIETKKIRLVKPKYLYDDSYFHSCLLADYMSETSVDPWWTTNDEQSQTNYKIEYPLHMRICAEIMFNEFGSKYQMMNIFLIQNKFLWKLYQAHRNVYKERLGESLNEMYLWHGTGADAANKICSQGLLRDHNKNMVHGKGVYFAKDIQTAAQYAVTDSHGDKHIFLCRVIVGESCKGNQRYQVPLCKPNSYIHYESMVDSVHRPTIFVISKDNQAYPEFLVKLRETPDNCIDNIIRLCHCGGELMLVHHSIAYGCNNGISCDKCDKRCSGNVYHCLNGKNAKHKRGYDLCESCV